MNPKYKLGQEVKIKDTKTIGKIVSIQFNDEIKQYAYEVMTDFKVSYDVFESEIYII